MSTNDSIFLNDKSQLESFYYRELLLNLIDSYRTLNEFLLRIDNHVTIEGDIDEKTIDNILSLMHRGSYINSISRVSTNTTISKLSKEAALIMDLHNELDSRIYVFTRSIAQCYKTKKDTYTNQIKKTIENCNMAIRQATQAEKSEAGAALAKLKEKCDEYYVENTALLRRELSEALDAKSRLETQLFQEREAQAKFMHLKENLIAEKEKAVQEALRLEKQEFGLEKRALIDRLTSEQERMKEDFNRQISNLTNAFESQIANEKRHVDEFKALLGDERVKMNNDVVRLRDELTEAKNQIIVEKEKCSLRIKDEMRRHEKELQQLQSENIQIQSKLKADLQEVIQKLKNQDLQRQDEIDRALSKDRENQAKAFQLQMERLENKYQAEVKRLQTQLNLSKEEEINRIKSLHEQEVKKLIREIDRLKKKPRPTPYDIDYHTEKAVDRSTDRTISLQHDDYTAKVVDLKNKAMNEQLAQGPIKSSEQSSSRWSKLRSSIDMQEQLLKRTSDRNVDDRQIPNTLALDEAFENAKQGSNKYHNVTSNAQKVSDYMDQLQEYLQNEDTFVDAESIFRKSIESKANHPNNDSTQSSSLFSDSVINI